MLNITYGTFIYEPNKNNGNGIVELKLNTNLMVQESQSLEQDMKNGVKTIKFFRFNSRLEIAVF